MKNNNNSWVSVLDGFPVAEHEVLILYKIELPNGNTINYQQQGFYIPENLPVEKSKFDWDWESTEYDFETDVSYISQGWYTRLNEEMMSYVQYHVTHWKELDFPM